MSGCPASYRRCLIQCTCPILDGENCELRPAADLGAGCHIRQFHPIELAFALGGGSARAGAHGRHGRTRKAERQQRECISGRQPAPVDLAPTKFSASASLLVSSSGYYLRIRVLRTATAVDPIAVSLQVKTTATISIDAQKSGERPSCLVFHLETGAGDIGFEKNLTPSS